MSVKRCIDKEKNIWAVVADNGSSSELDSGKAINIELQDTDELFESDNVEGAMTEIGYGLNQLSRSIKSNKDDIEYLKEHGGNGSGGGSSMPTITSDFKITKSDGQTPISVPIFYSSPNLGEGTAYIIINNVESGTQVISQGNNDIIIPPLGAGKITFSIYVKDRSGLLSNQLNWQVSSGGISMDIITNTKVDFKETSKITLRYRITSVTNEEINTKFTIDGTEYDVKSVNGVNTFDFPKLPVGDHVVKYKSTSGEYATKEEYFIICIINDSHILISIDFDQEKEYEAGLPINIPYRISIDKDEDFTIKFYINDELQKSLVTRPNSLHWDIESLDPGTYTLKIVATSDKLALTTIKEFTCKVVEGEYTKATPILDASLLAWFDATIKTNADSDRNVWVDKVNGYEGRLYNFNYGQNGWVKDETTGKTRLVMDGNSYVEIDMTPFINNVEDGCVIEMVFKVTNIGNEAARVLDITEEQSPYKGIYLDTRNAYLTTNNQSIDAAIGENEYIHLMYEIDRVNKYAHIIVNGVIVKSGKLADTLDANNKPIYESIKIPNKIYLNSRKGVSDFGKCEVSHLRIYETNFNYAEILQNHLSTISDIAAQKKLANFNDELKMVMPVMNITCDPEQFEKMSETNQIEVAMTYNSPNSDLYGETLTTATNCLMYWQGTSSIAYNIHNFNLILRDSDRNEIMYSPYQNCIPQSLFCLKANVMESTNAHNVGMATYVNDCLYTSINPAQKEDSRARRAIAGFPILLYINEKLIGVYDFNIDRYSYKAFGYDLPKYKNTCRVYEISANSNTTAGAFVPWTKETGMTEWEWYKRSFSGLYPLDIQNPVNDDFEQIKELVNFVYTSSDEDFIVNFPIHFNKESVIRYYIFVMLTGGVDSLGKNMKLVTFDGIKWELQFYDGDTIFGLDNTGSLKYDVDIEVEPGTFNTCDSTLWTRVRKLFDEDIKSEYINMRNGNFTIKKFYEYFFEKQIEKIPELQYNKSTQSKYLDNGDYVAMSYGNRYFGLKRWISERFNYCDSAFNYTPTLSKYITVRTGVTGQITFNIETYSPMWVKITWFNSTDGSGDLVLKVPRNKPIAFSGKVDAEDQEILIYCADNIKTIGDLSPVKPTHLILNQAEKLTELICPNDDKLLTVQCEKCSYLQHIDLHNSKSLGTLNTAQVLDVSGCNSLKYLNANGTSLKSINTNQNGGNIVELYVPTTLTSLILKNQYSLTTIGIPNTTKQTKTRLYEFRDNGSQIADFSLINCPLVENLNFTPFEVDGVFFDKYANDRDMTEFDSLEYKDDWYNILSWANGLGNATSIYIENSCEKISAMSFRSMGKLDTLTLRNMPNLKTLLLGANCNGYRKNATYNKNEADRLDIIGEFDWDKFNIIDCDNIEDFRIQELYSNNNAIGPLNNLTWFNFKEGTDTIDLSKKFKNLKSFTCNLAMQNVRKIIIPQSLETYNTSTWHEIYGQGNVRELDPNKCILDTIYFDGEHETDDFSGIDFSGHSMKEVRIFAPYATLLKGLNIKNEWVNPSFQQLKGVSGRPIVVPNGYIDLSEFKWHEISGWFAYINFNAGACTIKTPSDWDKFLKNINKATKMFYNCKNSNFTWDFAMKFFPKIPENNTDYTCTMYKYAQLKEQESFEKDAVDIYSDRNVFMNTGQKCPFEGTNLKYVRSVTNDATDGIYGLFQKATSLVKVGDVYMNGTTKNTGESPNLFFGCTSLEEVGNIVSVNNTKGGDNTLDINGMFNNTPKLRSVGQIDITASNVQYLYRNSGITDEGLQLPDTRLVKLFDYIFNGTTNLKNVELDVSNATNLMYSMSSSALENIYLKNLTSQTPIVSMDKCFDSSPKLVSVTIEEGETLPSTIEKINYLCNGCTSLTTFPKCPADFDRNISLEGVFYNCKSLPDETMWHTIPFKVTSIASMYYGCNSLLTPEIEIKSDSIIANSTFANCNNMTELTANFTGRLLRSCIKFAENCRSLSTINFKFPSSVYMHSYYETFVEGYKMFQNCDVLEVLNLDMDSLADTNTKGEFGEMLYNVASIKEIHGLNLTYLKDLAHPFNSANGTYDSHNTSITYGGNYQDLTVFDIKGMLGTSYNFRNINTLNRTKEILQHLDTVTSCVLGLTYNVMDAIDDDKNEYVDEELKRLALDAMSRGWTFALLN